MTHVSHPNNVSVLLPIYEFRIHVRIHQAQRIIISLFILILYIAKIWGTLVMKYTVFNMLHFLSWLISSTFKNSQLSMSFYNWNTERDGDWLPLTLNRTWILEHKLLNSSSVFIEPWTVTFGGETLVTREFPKCFVKGLLSRVSVYWIIAENFLPCQLKNLLLNNCN